MNVQTHESLIVCDAVTFSYPSVESGEDTVVLDALDWSVGRGETAAVVGPSGCGKSTLLNLIGALDTPSSGTVRVAGEDLSAMSENERARLRRERIGFVFQDHHLLPQCTVLENVLVPTVPLGGDASAAAERARELLDRVGLSERIRHRPGELSGGQRQRVAVVRALINEPDLVLADEPTGSLDEPTAAALVDLLIELNAERDATLIMVTHAMALAEQMGRVWRLHGGKLEEMSNV